MTSSKSFRATILPSSFSFPSFRSRCSSDSRPSRDSGHSRDSTPDAHKPRKLPWQKASLHLPRGRRVASPSRQAQRQAQQARLPDSGGTGCSAPLSNNDQRQQLSRPTSPLQEQQTSDPAVLTLDIA
ncbi:hypothetical protein E4U41_005022, partial [Claviceps citrina]